jgi:hypothetical protein
MAVWQIEKRFSNIIFGQLHFDAITLAASFG